MSMISFDIAVIHIQNRKIFEFKSWLDEKKEIEKKTYLCLSYGRLIFDTLQHRKLTT